MTIEELKRLIDNNDPDAVLQLKLDAAIDYARHYCNQRFEDSEGNADLPPAVKLGVAKLVESGDNPSNVSSESVGGELSQSFFSEDSTSASIVYFKPFRKLSWC